MKTTTRVLVLLGLIVGAISASAQVRISQVYGGGGNTGATYKNDFIELFNAGSSEVNVTGWAVQYASSTGTTWQKTALTGTIPAGGYYLVQEAQGTGGTVNLPTPDATGTIPMSGSNGKVALTSDSTSLAVGCPAGGAVQDFVGFGSANCSETSPTPALSNTTAALRNSNGCTDTGSNLADFTVGAPNPRNSASATNLCGGPSTISITTTSPLTGGTVGSPYSVTFAATGAASYSWSLASGTFDAGLTLSPEGVLSGTPLAAATYNFSIKAADGSAPSSFGVKSFSLTIAAPLTCTPSHTIAEVQGTGATSPYVGTTQSLRGVVTAVKSNGFFLQMTSGGTAGASSGVFVFTNSAPAVTVGTDACVTGTVSEYAPSTDLNSPPVTEIVSPTVLTMGAGLTLPAPVTITAADTLVNSLSNLEMYEGMRVQVLSLDVIAPTQGTKSEANATSTSNGVFYGVVSGVARPFREAGIQTPDPKPAGAPTNVPVFDANPERLRVDSDAMSGMSKIDVTAGATVTSLVGVMDYAYRTYTILPTVAPSVSGVKTYTAVPAPSASELTIGGANVERFYDAVKDTGSGDTVLTATAYANRLKKVSLQIRNVMQSPDIIGLAEVEKLGVVQDIAAQINADTVAGGGSNPGYTAYLEEGNDPGAIDVGFLVKSSRVTVVDVVQYGKTATYIDPNTSLPTMLNDRPPLVLRALVKKAGSLTALPVTVIANHLRSLNGVDDAADGARVRAKRQAQADYLANLVQARQVANPQENILLLGDFNAFEVNDGFVDVIGTILGTPAPADTVTVAGSDLVNPDLTLLSTTLAAADRYSYSYDGNAQSLDHMIVNSALLPRVSRFAVGRVNADFPEVYRSDANRPERLSDHDPDVAFVTLPDSVDVTSQAQITGSGLVYSRVTQSYSGTVTVKNTGATAITGPVAVVFQSLPAGVTLTNAAGTVAAGPYLQTSGPLAAGASATLTVKFKNTGATPISYSAHVVAGSLY